MGDYADGKPYGGHPGHRLIVQADEGISETMSDTPRTDDFESRMSGPADAALADALDHARDLERELAEQRAIVIAAQNQGLKDGQAIGASYAELTHTALRHLYDAAKDARWPLTAEQMLPMNEARRALEKNPNPSGQQPVPEGGTPTSGSKTALPTPGPEGAGPKQFAIGQSKACPNCKGAGTSAWIQDGKRLPCPVCQSSPATGQLPPLDAPTVMACERCGYLSIPRASAGSACPKCPGRIAPAALNAQGNV